MSWMRTGTVQVQAGSATVYGTGTNWVTGNVGQGFIGPDGRTYEILTIVTGQNLTLAELYRGANAIGQAYCIIPTQSYLLDLANRAAALIATYNDLAAGVGAGKFAAGTVSLPSVRGAADEDTGVNIPGSNVLQLVAGGAARLTIGADGKATMGEAITAKGFAFADQPTYNTGALVLGQGDGASSTVANLGLNVWFGLGISNRSTTGTVPQNENSHWFDARTGNMGMRGALTTGQGITAGGPVLAGGYMSATSLEIGYVGTTNTPVLDFHSSASSTDFDTRLVSVGGTSANGAGTLNFYGAAFGFYGPVTMNGGLVINGGLTVNGASALQRASTSQGLYGSSASITTVTLNTPVQLPLSGALPGILVLRDKTLGGAAAYLVDPNGGVIPIASNIAGISVTNAGAGQSYNWQVQTTSGTAARSFGFSFFVAAAT